MENDHWKEDCKEEFTNNFSAIPHHRIFAFVVDIKLQKANYFGRTAQELPSKLLQKLQNNDSNTGLFAKA